MKKIMQQSSIAQSKKYLDHESVKRFTWLQKMTQNIYYTKKMKNQHSVDKKAKQKSQPIIVTV